MNPEIREQLILEYKQHQNITDESITTFANKYNINRLIIKLLFREQGDKEKFTYFEEFFQKTQHPTAEDYVNMAVMFGATKDGIKKWFTSKRSRLRGLLSTSVRQHLLEELKKNLSMTDDEITDFAEHFEVEKLAIVLFFKEERDKLRVEACRELFAKTQYQTQEERSTIAKTYRAEESMMRAWFKVERNKKQKSEKGLNRSVLEESIRPRLLEIYKQNKHPLDEDIDDIAEELEKDVDAIKKWFEMENKKLKNLTLEKAFEKNPHPGSNGYKAIAEVCDRELQDVRDWFQAKRGHQVTVFTAEQKLAMERFAQENQRPTDDEYLKFAEEHNLRKEAVRTWFLRGCDKRQLSAEDREELEEFYKINPKFTDRIIKELSSEMNKTEEAIAQWFRIYRLEVAESLLREAFRQLKSNPSSGLK